MLLEMWALNKRASSISIPTRRGPKSMNKSNESLSRPNADAVY
jgi:hypothetical protein